MCEQESADDFQKRCATIVDDGLKCLSLQIGHRLKLFDSIVEIASAQNPKTSEEIAAKANLKERYVREWLGCMVVSKIIECDPTGTKFWIPENRAAILHSNNKRSPLNLGAFLPMFGPVLKPLMECFQLDGPGGLSYDLFGEFQLFQWSMSSSYFEQRLLADFVPEVDGLDALLKRGVKVLDVCCGKGTISRVMAQHYPNSHFWGIDLGAAAIAEAKKSAGDLKNVHYLEMDATELKEEWAGTFDYVTCFDGIHDLAYPDKTLREIFKILKPGAFFSCVDIKMTSNVFEDREKHANTSVFVYHASLFYCMPVSLNFPDGMGLGAAWGEAKAREMFEAAGFVVEEMKGICRPIDLHYLCKKAL